MRRAAGFTLLEMCLVVAICLLIVLIAVPSVRGALAAQRLHTKFETFDNFARQAQARSISERRTYVLTWEKEAIEMIPWDLRQGEQRPEIARLPVGEKEDYAIERPAALAKEPGPAWTFWRSGVCEPAIISYKGPEGQWRAQYDALTVHGTILVEEAR